MDDKRLKKFKSELKYLNDDNREKEYNKYKNKIKNDEDVINYAKEIYESRGIEYKYLSNNIFNKLLYEIKETISKYKVDNKKKKRAMFWDITFMIILLVLIKIPFNLVRDISYDYILIVYKGYLLYYVWRLLFLLVYTIVMICVAIILLRNFNDKYKK